jgi:hypothetical protein
MSSRLAASLLLLALQTAFPARAETVAAPDTPAGQVLAAWIDAVNSNDLARAEQFDSIHDGRVPGNASNLLRLRGQTGGFDLASVSQSEPRYVEFAVKERATGREAIGMMEVSDATPPRIVNSQVRLPPPGARLIGFGIDAATRDRVINGTLTKLDEFYVFPETAKKMAAAVREREKKGEYANVRNGVQLALLLTTHLQEVSRDRHLRVTFSPFAAGGPGGPGPGSGPGPGPRGDPCGFEKAERLDGNIGYIKLNVFADPAECREAASAAMARIADVDAVIFDLRDNGGGRPQMVALLTSYLFAQRTHLNDLWNRTTGQTEEFWTTEDVPGKKLTTQPVYVLTSQRTFSGAEEFSYNLKNLKRATIVGETTGGGAHPVAPQEIDERFVAVVPNGRAINPITKTNWEGVGVEPDVKVPAAEALLKARELAGKGLASK